MDNASDTVLRPASQLSTHIYGMGYRRTEGCHPCWGIDVSDVWQEVVIDYLLSFNTCPNSCLLGLYGVESIVYYFG